LQMFDKERGIEAYVEKAAAFKIKVDRLRERCSQLKEEQGDENTTTYDKRKSLAPYNLANSIDNSIASSPRDFGGKRALQGKKQPLKYSDDDFK